MIYEVIYVKELKDKSSIHKREDAFRLVQPYLETKKEQLLLITLDSAYDVIGVYIIHVGSINPDNTVQQNILEQTLLDKSKTIVICRMRLGESKLGLSQTDHEIAIKLKKSCELLDIRILFQLIVSECGYTEIMPDPNNDDT
jgi:DNA repair protein RadC